MKKMGTNILTVSIILSFLILFGVSLEDTYAEDSVSKEEINSVLEKIDQLSDNVKKLEKKKDKDVSADEIQEKIEEMQGELEEFSSILDRIETKTLVDSINLSADMRTRVDWYDFKGYENIPFTNIKNGKYLHEETPMLPSNRVRFNLSSKMGDNLVFHSRLVMFRHWSDDDIPVYPDVTFLNRSRVPTDLLLKVERVYVDYFYDFSPEVALALTFGRIPTTDSMPTDFHDDTERKSTYPALAYDVETDGIGLSIVSKHLLGLENPSVKFLYARRYDDNSSSFLGIKLSNKTGIYRVDEMADDTLDIMAMNLETGLPRPLNNTKIMFNIIYIPWTRCPDLRYNRDLNPLYTDTSGKIIIEKPDSIGSLKKFTAFIQSKNFLNTPLDWFIGASYVKTKARGALKFWFNPSSMGLPGNLVLARDAYDKYKAINDILPDVGNELKKLQGAPSPIGLLNDDGVSDRVALACHLGLRVQLPFKALNFPKFGLEYNRGSRYWMGFNDGAEDPLHKLNTRGEVLDYYYFQPFDEYFSLRVGYTHAKNDYSQGLSFYYGQPYEIAQTITNTYFLFDAKF